MQRLVKRLPGGSQADKFEAWLWVMAGCALLMALTGMYQYFTNTIGQIVLINSLALSIIPITLIILYRLNTNGLRRFIESISFDLWMSDQDGRYFIQSAESQRLIGDITGKTPDELDLPPEILMEWKTTDERTKRGEMVYREDSWIVDGGLHNFLTIISPVKNEEENIGYVGINIDITERKKSEKQLQHSAEQLAMLNHIARAITTLGNVDNVLNMIREQVQRILPLDAFLVLLYDKETNMVSFPLVYDNGQNWSEPDRELAPDMKTYHIIATGESLLVNLTPEEFNKTDQTPGRSLTGDRNAKYRSFLYAPLIRKGSVIGVVVAISYKFNAYSQEQLKLLEGVAVQASIAIENARLFQSQQRELAERKQAEEEVRKLNAELEERVARRTLQLQEANTNLNIEKFRLEKYNLQRKIMAEMTNMLQASNTTKEAGEIVSRHLKMLFPNSSGILHLLSESNIFEKINSWGHPPSPDATLSINDCWGLRRGKPYQYGTASHNPPCTHLEENLPKQAICIPLLAHGDSLGNLTISANDGNEDLLDTNEQRFLETIADSIALAFANLRLRDELHQQSIHDALTGLYNRRFLDDILPREINRAHRGQRVLSILLFDIDHFKTFNDDYGHDAGDQVLRSVSEIIQSSIRESDIACRYGGEEFIIILPDTPSETAVKRAESLRKDIEKLELNHKGRSLGMITVSIGVATYPQNGENRNTLVKAADNALYHAKQAGRNQVVLSS